MLGGGHHGPGRTSLTTEYVRLNQVVQRLGQLAGEMLADAVQALAEQDYDLAESVRKRDSEADALDHQVEDASLNLLALQAPVASDLRGVTGVARITTELERVADYAKDIAKAAKRLVGETYYWELEDIPSMARACGTMLAQAMEALGSLDPEQAAAVVRMDSEVDELWKRLRSQLVAHMEQDPQHVRQTAELLLVARYLERIGDHIVNVAERVYYMATGDICSLD